MDKKAKMKKQRLFDQLFNEETIDTFPKTDSVLIDTADILPSSYEEFHINFAEMFQTSLSVFESLEKRLLECESTVNEYGDMFFLRDGDAFIPMKKEPRRFSISLDDIDQLDPTSELGIIIRRRKQLLMSIATDDSEKERKTVENLGYAPFQSDVYNDWASDMAVEVIDILNKVTQAQNFKTGFLHYWNKVSRSDTSQAILKDAFWWFYLKYFVVFNKLPNAAEECDQYFLRMATNYVELLLSVDPWFRDKFFNTYPPYLAQAVYQAFFDTCPDSRMNLTDKFKEFISSTIFEWVTGTHSTPEAYKQWKIRADATMLTSDNVGEQTTSSNDIYKRILHLEQELEALGDEGVESARSTVSKTPQIVSRKNPLLTYNEVADIESELFSLSNQSTLVTRFLEQCQIQPTTPRQRSIHRVLVKNWSINR